MQVRLLLWPLLTLAAVLSPANTDPRATCHIIGRSREQVSNLLIQHQQVECYDDFIRQVLPSFDGVRYGGGGAGAPWNKTLVNTEEMDCVTFVENVFAMAMAIHEAGLTPSKESDAELFGLFVRKLNQVRYYGGVVDGRQKRIIYFTDAMRNLMAQGLLMDVGAMTGIRFTKRIHYMTSNPSRFAGITDWNEVRRTERELSEACRFYYPLDSLHRYEAVAQNGDIAALATKVDGLDVSHVGFLTVRDGRVKFTHASFSTRKVEVEQDLRGYLATRTSITGILVFRPLFM